MKQISPKDANQILQSDPEAILLDVRSELEYMFVGHPVGAIHVPWQDGPDWDINPHFVSQVKKLAGKERPVLLICRSGIRSAEAAQQLEKEGWQHVYNILYGFEGELDERHHRSTLSGWRHEGLPWEQM